MTPPQKPRLSRGALSPAGSEAGSSVSSKLPRPSSSVSMSRISPLPRPPSTGALSSRGPSGDLADSSSAGCNQKDYISVAVRVRPIKYEHPVHPMLSTASTVIPHQGQLATPTTCPTVCLHKAVLSLCFNRGATCL